jgi:hypothetical protein
MSIFGQHDLYMYAENRKNTNLGILIEAGLVSEIEKPYFQMTERIRIYPVNWGEEIPKPEIWGGKNILVAHYPVGKREIYPGQRFFEAQKFLRDHNDFDIIHVGDIHQRFEYADQNKKSIILNPGPLFRDTAAEDMLKHHPGFYVVETDGLYLEFFEVPHEPWEKVLTRDHIDRENEITRLMDGFVEKLTLESEGEGLSFSEVLNELLDKAKASTGVRAALSKAMEEKV